MKLAQATLSLAASLLAVPLHAQAPGLTYYKDPLLDPETQRIILEASREPARPPRWIRGRLPGHACSERRLDGQGRLLRDKLVLPDGTIRETEYKPAGEPFRIVVHGPKGTLELARLCGPACGSRARAPIIANGWPTPWAHEALMTGERERHGAQALARGASRPTRSPSAAPVPVAPRRSAAASKTSTYDANGNLISDSEGNRYRYDFDDRLTRVEKPDGSVIEHVYDVDGNRVRTQVPPANGPPQVTDFLVDPSGPLSHVVAETDDAGALKAHYVRGDDLLAAMRPLTPAPSGPAEWLTRYFHADGVGSIRALTNELGLVTDTYTYTAFGERIAHTGNDPQPYAFAGEPWDPNSGFQYHRARWMDPRVGRFTGMDRWPGDPFAPATLHRYVYGSANPVNRVDPSGNADFTLLGMTFSVSINNIVRGVAQVIPGAIFGAIDGGLRAQLQNEDWVVGGLKGMRVGMLVGPLARVKRAQPYLISMGTALAGAATFDAFLDDNDGLALYNGILFVGGAASVLSYMTTTEAIAGPVLVYRSRPNPTTGEVVYVGITQNFQTRAAVHLRKKGIEIEEIGQMTNLGRDDARAVEQTLIEFYGLGKNGGSLLNKINSISATDPGYAALLARGRHLLHQSNYPGF